MRRLTVIVVALVMCGLSGCGFLSTSNTETVTSSDRQDHTLLPPTPTSLSPSEPDNRLVTVNGVGGIRLGMTGAELGPYVQWGSVSDCGFDAFQATARLRGDYPGLAINYVFRSGRVDWILIKETNEPYHTAEGARLGTTEAQLKALYGSALIKIQSPQDGNTYEVREAEQSIVFSIWDAGKVGSILVRYLPLWPQPC